MAERSKGFKIGAIGLFICAIGLLSYVWFTSGDDGPAVVPPEIVAGQNTVAETSQAPTIVNAQATEETHALEAPEAAEEEAMTPERVKQARSFMN